MTDHFREAEQILAELVATEQAVNNTGGIAADAFDHYAAERAHAVSLAHVHALLAVAAKQAALPPGSCTIRGPRDSYTVTVDGRDHVYERAGECTFLFGHAGDCSNSSGHRWNANTHKAADQIFPAEQGEF